VIYVAGWLNDNMALFVPNKYEANGERCLTMNWIPSVFTACNND
jgi:hypothetical protein